MSHWQCDSKEKKSRQDKKRMLALNRVNNLFCNPVWVGLFQPSLGGHGRVKQLGSELAEPSEGTVQAVQEGSVGQLLLGLTLGGGTVEGLDERFHSGSWLRGGGGSAAQAHSLPQSCQVSLDCVHVIVHSTTFFFLPEVNVQLIQST